LASALKAQVLAPLELLTWVLVVVGVVGFEPTTSSSRRRIPCVGRCRPVPSVLVSVPGRIEGDCSVLDGLVPF